MNNKSIEFEIISKIFFYYPNQGHFLHFSEPFTFMTAVILSQSSTDKTAEKITNWILYKYKDIATLAELSLEEIEEIIKSAGLKKNKARGIKALAEIKKRGEKLPETVEELIQIPSISLKTANCYLSFIGKSAVIVDTHFFRAATRLNLAKGKSRDAVYKEIREQYPEEIWSHMSYALNALARDFCHAKRPECEKCPVRELCKSEEKLI